MINNGVPVCVSSELLKKEEMENKSQMTFHTVWRWVE